MEPGFHSKEPPDSESEPDAAGEYQAGPAHHLTTKKSMAEGLKFVPDCET